VDEVLIENLLFEMQLAVAVVILNVGVVVASGIVRRLAAVLRYAPPPLPVDDMLSGRLERREIKAIPAARIG
jgi:hypothetical protein